MFDTSKVWHTFVSITIISILWIGLIPGVFQISAVNAAIINSEVTSQEITSSSDWYEIDQHLVEAVKITYDITEKYASTEIDNWQVDLMRKVDDKFLNWYFNYANQKLMEYGVPFAWAVFKLDSKFKVFRKEDEKVLNAAEVIQKRMTEDFNDKFHELVLNQEAEKSFKRLVENIGRNYASALGVQFLRIKSNYKITDQNWGNHLNNISNIIYTTREDVSIFDANTKLLTKVSNATTTLVGLKLAANFAAKVGSKLAAKGAATILVQTGTQFIDPMLIVGFLAWDVWDYNRMVATSRPELRRNISDYLDEVKYSILSSPENSIMGAIKDVESTFLNALPQPI